MSDKLRRHDSLAFAVLAASLVPFMFRGVEYALLDSYVPMTLIVVFLCLLALGYLTGGFFFRLSVRLWSIVLLLYGVIRLGLGVMLAIWPLPREAHAMAQFTLPYHVFSAAFLLAGIYLIRNAKVLLVRGK